MRVLSNQGSLNCIILGLLFLLSGITSVNAQQSVSIGTSTIKANAVLYLKGTGTQGLILPAVSSNGNFGEAGMLVFNITDNKLYYHNGTAWIDATSASEIDGVIGNEVTQVNSARGGLELTGAGTNASPLSIGLVQGTTDGQILQWNNTTKKWELKTISGSDSQDLSLTGTTLSLTNDLTPVTLGNLAILNTVGSAQITDGSVAAVDLAAGSVSGGAAGTITDGSITNADIATTAAIAVNKLAPGTNGQVLTISGGAPSWQTLSASVTKLDDLSDVAVTSASSGQVLVNDGLGNFKNVSVSGDINVSSTGAATIQPGAISGGTAGDITDGTITNADISGTAAIAGTKISPDFGTQNITTTGKTSFNTISYAWPNAQGAANTFLKNDGSGNLSWSTTPTFSTTNVVPKGNGTGLTASSIFDNGNVGINTTNPTTKLQVDDTTPTLRLRSTVSTSLSNSFVEFGHDDGSGGFTSVGTIGDVGSGDYVEIQSPNMISFNTNFATQMSINSSGNVGIGTTSAGNKFEVQSTNSVSEGNGAGVFYANVSNFYNALIAMGNDTGTPAGTNNYSRANLACIPKASPVGPVNIGAWGHCYGAGAGGAGLLATYGSDPATASIYAALASSSYSGIFMGGNVGIGLTNPSQKLEVAGNIKTTGQLFLTGSGTYNANVSGTIFQLIYGTGTTGSSIEVDGYNTTLGKGFVGGGTRLTVGNSGDGSVAVANSWTLFSDVRLKENIQTIDHPLDLVSGLRGVRFKWKTSQSNDVGFIAQEVEKVIPDIVFTNPETGYKSVSYEKIVAVLTEAIKEQQKTIDDLKAQVTALQNKTAEENSQMKKELAEIKRMLNIEANKK